MDIKEWNKKIYKHSNVKSKPFSEVLWNAFEIKSWPLFKDACSYHVPDLWREEVIKLIYKTRNVLGDRIQFSQIKEKFCYLTIYYSAKDDEAKQLMESFVEECRKNLIEKGIHPKGEENE